MLANLIKKGEHFYSLILFDNKEILATTEDAEGALKLSLKNCQAIELGYDLDELVDDFINCPESMRTLDEDWRINSFKKGFQKALEILGDKKFSEFDITKAFEYGWNQRHFDKTDEDELREIQKRFIQSLQHVEWDVEVEMEKVIDETKIVGAVKGVKGSGNKITTYKSVPKLDADGCLILRRMSPDSSN